MANAPMIISRDMRSKHMCMKVDEKVSILGVIKGDEEQVFFRKIHIDR
jgi:hypothetical protein